MIEPAIRTHIDAKLAAVAAEHGVRIVYAAESGSRAWGFASPDSDYDVRFIYVHPRDWYVRLAEGRDVIEKGIDDRLIDLNGWDIRKALRLMLRSNPTFYEWLVSPIVYGDDGTFRPVAKALFEAHASRRAVAYHYWSIARGQWRSEIEREAAPRLKKYFYVVRPLLSLAWVARHATPPPMSIDALLAACPPPPGPAAAIADLLARKRATPEIGRDGRIAALDDWAQAALDALHPDRLALGNEPARDATEGADTLFRRMIGVGEA